MSTAVGNRAEDAATDYLKKLGYKVLNRNWRTRWCEIDIVCKRDNVVYFVEVKYRKNANFGDGFEYITPAKLKQMHFAAEIWLAENKDLRGEYRLSAVSVKGDDYAIDEWLSDL